MAPTKANTIGAVSADIAGAIAHVPVEVQGDILKMATAIYAATSRGVMDEAAQKTAMEGAIQSALGQTVNQRQQTVGGVQTVGEFPVLLPPDVAGEDVEAALEAAFGGGFQWRGAPMASDYGGQDAAIWAKAGIYGNEGSVPMKGGVPVPGSLMGNMRITPVTGTIYRMDYVNSSGPEPVRDADGGPFLFDINGLLEAVK